MFNQLLQSVNMPLGRKCIDINTVWQRVCQLKCSITVAYQH